MAKRDKDLVDTLRASGLRKKVAKALADSADSATGEKAPKALRRSAARLRSAASTLERRAEKSRRSDAAQKGARTRQRNAAKRSAAAKRGARTRSGRP
jgi:hypothetical protein